MHASSSWFSDERMPGYDEKSDVWKIPDALELILFSSNSISEQEDEQADSLNVRARKQVRRSEYLQSIETVVMIMQMAVIRMLCKVSDPRQRPPASEVVSLWRASFQDVINKEHIPVADPDFSV